MANVTVEKMLNVPSVRVSWDGVLHIPELSGYIIYYGQTRNGVKVTENSMNVSSSIYSAVVSDLVLDTIYIFQVAATAEVNGLTITGERSHITDMSLVLFSGTTTAGMKIG